MGFFDKELYEEQKQVQARLGENIVDEINNQHNDNNGNKIGLPATIDQLIELFEHSLAGVNTTPNIVQKINKRTIEDLKRYKEIVVQQEADVE